MSYKEKVKKHAERLKESQRILTERGLSDMSIDALLDCCEALADLLEQIEKAYDLMISGRVE